MKKTILVIVMAAAMHACSDVNDPRSPAIEISRERFRSEWEYVLNCTKGYASPRNRVAPITSDFSAIRFFKATEEFLDVKEFEGEPVDGLWVPDGLTAQGVLKSKLYFGASAIERNDVLVFRHELMHHVLAGDHKHKNPVWTNGACGMYFVL